MAVLADATEVASAVDFFDVLEDTEAASSSRVEVAATATEWTYVSDLVATTSNGC